MSALGWLLEADTSGVEGPSVQIEAERSRMRRADLGKTYDPNREQGESPRRLTDAEREELRRVYGDEDDTEGEDQ